MSSVHELTCDLLRRHPGSNELPFLKNFPPDFRFRCLPGHQNQFAHLPAATQRFLVDMFKWLCRTGSLERGESIC